MKTLHELAFPVTDIAAALDWYRGAGDVSTVFADAHRALVTHENVALLLVCPDDFPGRRPVAHRISRSLQTPESPVQPEALPAG